MSIGQGVARTAGTADVERVDLRQQDDRSHRPTGGANPESSVDEPIERQHTNCVMNCRVRPKTQAFKTIAIRFFLNADPLPNHHTAYLHAGLETLFAKAASNYC